MTTQNVIMEQDFIDFNGNKWSKSEVSLYNKMTIEIEKTNQLDLKEYLMTQRFNLFNMIVTKHNQKEHSV